MLSYKARRQQLWTKKYNSYGVTSLVVCKQENAGIRYTVRSPMLLQEEQLQAIQLVSLPTSNECDFIWFTTPLDLVAPILRETGGWRLADDSLNRREGSREGAVGFPWTWSNDDLTALGGRLDTALLLQHGALHDVRQVLEQTRPRLVHLVAPAVLQRRLDCLDELGADQLQAEAVSD